MMNLIDDLLEYSQAASGTAEPGSVDLNQTLTNVLEDLEIEIAKKQAAVSVGALPEIKGNSRQMHQLFQNLISNSLKYSQPVIPPEIRIISRVVNGRDISSELPPDIKFHCIEVTDNGIGFDQKYADGIFKLFTRLHSDPQYKGSGIGLSIVKKWLKTITATFLLKVARVTVPLLRCCYPPELTIPVFRPPQQVID